MNYIGVDCHISTLEFDVVNERGTITKKAKVNTGVKEFMSFTKAINSLTPVFTFAFLVMVPISLTTANSKVEI